MKFPKLGISARLTLLIVALVLICQLINGFVLVEVQRNLRRERFEDITAERLTQAVRMAEFSPGASRRLGRRQAVRILSRPPQEGVRDETAEAALLRVFADNDLGDREVRVVTFAERGRPPFVIAAAQLNDGRWIHYRQILPPSVRAPWVAISVQTAVLTLVLLIPAVWVGRRVATPLRQVTAVADGFLTGRPAPSLPSGGPPDVEALCKAFASLEQRVLKTFEEKAVMFGAIGHDLRTPLASLRIRVESVADEKLRAEMISSIEALAATLDDVLAFSQATTSEGRERVRADALLRNLQADYAPEVLSIGVTEGLTVQGAPQALLRALRNLVDNAVRYGTHAEVSVYQSGQWAQFVVTDDGPGILPERMEQMLQPFERAEPSRSREKGGTGLGLSIAKAVAEIHGGTLSLKNRESGGLKATMSVPLAAEMS